MAENDDAQEPEPRRALAIGGDAGGKYPFREFLRLDGRREALVYSQAGSGQTAPPPCECCPPCLWCDAWINVECGQSMEAEELAEWEYEHGFGAWIRFKSVKAKARAEVTPLGGGHPAHALFADTPGRNRLLAESQSESEWDYSGGRYPGTRGVHSWVGGEPESADDEFRVRCGELRVDTHCYGDAWTSAVVRYPCRVVLEAELSFKAAGSGDYEKPEDVDEEVWEESAEILRQSGTILGCRIRCGIRANAWTKLNVFRSEVTVGTDDERLEEGLEDTPGLDVVLARSGEFEPNLGTTEQILDVLRKGDRARWRLELLVTRAAEPDSGEGGA